MDREFSSAERHGQGLRRAWPWVAGAVVLTLLAVWGSSALRPSLDAADTRTARVARGDLEATLTASGTLVPKDEEVVSSPLRARVLRVLQRPGALVEAGEPLLELDVSAAELALERIEGSIEQSEDQAREAEADLDDELLDLRTRRELKALDLEDQGYTHERNERLLGEGLVSETEVRQSRVRVRKAQLELAQLEQSLRNKERSGRAQVRRLESQLRTLQAEREQARLELELATTRAPRSGVLTWIVTDEGSTVGEGDVLARIADLHSFRVDGTVADLHAGRVREGLPVVVPLGSERLRGRVVRVLPAIEGGQLQFEAELEQPAHPLLRASLRVDLLVVTAHRSAALHLPRGAYLNGSGLQEVFVVEGELARRREVEIGLAGVDGWEILSGLEEGELVILSDLSTISHLSEVRWRSKP